jgi:hypothetical protein
MKNSRMYIVLVVAGLLLLADKAMAQVGPADFRVPEGGATALLLATGLGGLALLRRFSKSRK